MARVFERGLTSRRAIVLPVQRWNAADERTRWRSEKWTRGAASCSCAGRHPGRLPPAARLAALCAAGRLSRYVVRSRSDRAARRAATRSAAAAAAPAPRSRHRGQTQAANAGAHCADGRTARRRAVRVHAAGRAARGLSRTGRGGRGDRRRARTAGADRGLSAAGRSAHERHQGHARSRRDRGQHPSGAELARGVDITHRPLRGGAAVAARRRQVHDRRPAHRHRRRQSRRGRRRDAGRQSRSCAGPIC